MLEADGGLPAEENKVLHLTDSILNEILLTRHFFHMDAIYALACYFQAGVTHMVTTDFHLNLIDSLANDQGGGMRCLIGEVKYGGVNNMKYIYHVSHNFVEAKKWSANSHTYNNNFKKFWEYNNMGWREKSPFSGGGGSYGGRKEGEAKSSNRCHRQ